MSSENMGTPAHAAQVATELGLGAAQVVATAALLDNGATVPFIARYRKEATGSLDEVQIAAVRDRLARLAELDKRRGAIVSSLEERGLMTPELQAALRKVATLTALEDLYLPFRPKRRTRATVARERRLEPLAQRIFNQEQRDRTEPEQMAAEFVDPGREVASAEEALQGARDIIAESVSEDAGARSDIRRMFAERARITTKLARGKEQEAAKFRDYFDWSEPASDAPSHRLLAAFRGEAEGMLAVRVAPPEEDALAMLERRFCVKVPGSAGPAPRAVVDQVRRAVTDGYRRLLGPSMETEFRAALKARADEEAIRVFASNLRELLLAPPVGRKVVLALDPGFRSGCKMVVLNRQGRLLHHDTVQPHQSDRLRQAAADRIREAVSRYGVEVIAVGNGTAGRETEAFIRGLDLDGSVAVAMVNESGASVYSASEIAREELPDQDITVRGAVSIGRRLADPLAELVKIDPKSIGVGQYQHDVDQGALKRSLDDVVAAAVNNVGVEVNTASRSLLTYVSGVGPQLASNIVAFRDEQGPFRSRHELKKVARLGAKAFEQAAGFLRIRDGDHPLDASAVHPESYRIVDAMARDLGVRVRDLMTSVDLRGRIEPSRYVAGQAGLPTIRDILEELAKPGRDPRGTFEPFHFAPGVESLEDLEPGVRVPGIVTNVTGFGAFVDVGVHQDGLVHISQLADRYVRDPREVVRVNQTVVATVLSVDLARRRLSLSLRTQPE